jgi:glycosyltransferase involved in cell wall biosynthesis
MKWSILIPSLFEREHLLNRLLNALHQQIHECKAEGVEIVIRTDNRELSIGAKRNQLIEMAKGEYFCFFDDDDLPENNYIKLILEAIEQNPDVIPINGYMTIRGENPIGWEMGLEYERKTITNHLGQVQGYEAPPNHLAVFKRSLVKNYLFQDISWGEDSEWADRLKNNNVLKTQIRIKEKIYHYVFTK